MGATSPPPLLLCLTRGWERTKLPRHPPSPCIPAAEPGKAPGSVPPAPGTALGELCTPQHILQGARAASLPLFLLGLQERRECEAGLEQSSSLSLHPKAGSFLVFPARSSYVRSREGTRSPSSTGSLSVPSVSPAQDPSLSPPYLAHDSLGPASKHQTRAGLGNWQSQSAPGKRIFPSPLLLSPRELLIQLCSWKEKP